MSFRLHSQIQHLKSSATTSRCGFSVERAFEVICEASRRLPDDVKARERSIDWRRMVDFGNQLRHAYHRINPQMLTEIAVRDLPPLKTFAQRVIAESKQ